MPTHVALLRGINVGGNNMIAMADLAEAFRAGGYDDVRTYIQSGNVVFSTDEQDGRALEAALEALLEARFGSPILVVVRSRAELAATLAAAPADHGAEHLRSDVMFLKHPLSAEDAAAAFPELREGVDSLALGPGAIYFSRVAERASSSRLSRVVGTPVYRQMTVRNWRTTTRLLAMLEEA